MKRFACSILVTFLSGASMLAQTKSLLIEDLTWTEVRDAIIAGKTTAIYYAGSIEQNGPGMALGKHVFIARYLAPKIAEQLDNALVYPVMPFAPTGDWGVTQPGTIDPAKKSRHMRYNGSVSVSDETFGAVAHDVAMSAIAAGFKDVVLMGDHGGGQATLAKVAEGMSKEWGPRNSRVLHSGPVLQRKGTHEEVLTETGLAH